jgi:zinc transport system ATP-binding protein
MEQRLEVIGGGKAGERDGRREVISVEHLWAGYGRDPVLEDINLSVREGDFVGLIGPNGGGKTTLLKVLLGLLPPTRGRVRIMGMRVREGRRHIGYVPQVVEFDRDFPVSVWDVVRMGRLGTRRLLQRYTQEDDEVVADALRNVEMLDLSDRPMGALSGGQQQRVYIARALAAEPAILLLDEPTSHIDTRASEGIYELLRQLNERVTILLISHDMNVVASYVTSVGCLNRWLFYHEDRQLSPDMLEAAYQCPVDLIAHGVPHRVFPEHLSGASDLDASDLGSEYHEE